jgi:hypothetical protein
MHGATYSSEQLLSQSREYLCFMDYEFYYRVGKRLPLVLTRNKMNRAHHVPPNFFKIHFNIIL